MDMSMKSKIETEADGDADIILVCAFRYALGRRTYVVDCVANEILRKWKYLRDSDKSLFVKEILEHKNVYGNLGMECDAKSWERIIEKAREDGVCETSLV